MTDEQLDDLIARLNEKARHLDNKRLYHKANGVRLALSLLESIWVNGNFISDHYSQDSAKAAFDNIVRAEQEVPR